MATRQEIRIAYEAKALESLTVATNCLTQRQFRAACNRSWYAIMQIITACMYQRTTETPLARTGAARINWPHMDCQKNLRTLINTCANNRLGNSLRAKYLPSIGMLLDYRNISDYRVPPDHDEITDNEASHAVRTARQIVDTVRSWL